MNSEASVELSDRDEERAWYEYKKTSSPKLREQLIIKYASLVKYIAGRIAVTTPPNIEFDDLVSYGILGLIDAIEKYDPKMGCKFKTYATIRIKGAIYDELRLLDWVPRSVRQKAKDIEQVYSSLELRLGRPATDEEVAQSMNITVEELNQLTLEVSGASVISLDDIKYIGGDSDEVSIRDTVESHVVPGPEIKIEREEVKRLLIEAINKLPQREREVIALYYYEELTLREIGEVLGVTESRVSQLHTKAIMRLRGYLSRARATFVLT
ncbi:TPA: RNA polymerase sigma factor WhiG [bacterium]|nr:RNA polymerase sigma factor WhiG [bacterium]